MVWFPFLLWAGSWHWQTETMLFLFSFCVCLSGPSEEDWSGGSNETCIFSCCWKLKTFSLCCDLLVVDTEGTDDSLETYNQIILPVRPVLWQNVQAVTAQLVWECPANHVPDRNYVYILLVCFLNFFVVTKCNLDYVQSQCFGVHYLGSFREVSWCMAGVQNGTLWHQRPFTSRLWWDVSNLWVKIRERSRFWFNVVFQVTDIFFIRIRPWSLLN